MFVDINCSVFSFNNSDDGVSLIHTAGIIINVSMQLDGCVVMNAKGNVVLQ